MDEPECILSLSYGKDSLGCLPALEQLGWPLHRIIHAEVWATDAIPADLPPMVEFKKKADRIIKERWGIEVEHVRSKWTYERGFYRGHIHKNAESPLFRLEKNGIYGFPVRMGPWCSSELKVAALSKARRGAGCVYIGIAADEPERLQRLEVREKSPIAEVGWTEKECREWCEKNDLLSPIYATATRGGCWFCHNQGVQQLRLLRRNYPELWALLLKWDADSPVAFHANGHTVHDFDRRFQMEDRYCIDTDATGFRWEMLEKGIPDKYLIKAATSPAPPTLKGQITGQMSFFA